MRFEKEDMKNPDYEWAESPSFRLVAHPIDENYNI